MFHFLSGPGRALAIPFFILSMACIPVDHEIHEDSLPPNLRGKYCTFQDSLRFQSIKDVVTPTRKLTAADYPEFEDDLDFEYLDEAMTRQLKHYANNNLNGTIQFGKTVYPKGILVATLIKFQNEVRGVRKCIANATEDRAKQICREKFKEMVVETFDIYAPDLEPEDPRYGDSKDTFFTGYFTPTIQVTTKKTNEFSKAIYTKPHSYNLSRSTRGEIDFQKRLYGYNYEVYYTNDLFELYLMQVQGSGRVRIMDEANPTPDYLLYGGTNKQSWNFISRHMMSRGYISDPTIYSQKEFLLQNPQLEEEIYSSCPSYVYFNKSKRPPVGSGNVSVTYGRSLALDTNYYPFKGTLSFIKTERPKEGQIGKDPRKDTIDYKTYSRFALDQDTGGAIKGKARVDVYYGDDAYARMAAYNAEHYGNLYFLVIKR